MSSLRYTEEGGGSVVTRWFDRVTVESVYEGPITPRIMQQAEEDFAKLVSKQPALYRLVDTSGMTGYDRNIKGGVAELWSRFKALGGREVVFVTTLSLAKMSGSVVGMNVSLPVKFFETRLAALEYLASRPRS